MGKAIVHQSEGRKCPVIGDLLFKMYGGMSSSSFGRTKILNFVSRLEGSFIYSLTVRQIFATYHDVHIGMYTHGGCFVPGAIDRGTTIGRYCSIANPVSVLNANHPVERKSMHGFFFNPELKICKERSIPTMPLEIGNDVWLGKNCIIMPHVRTIADGAVIAAGAVVNKNVPPYAIVVGNPARIVRYRFSKTIIDDLLASKWWLEPIEEIKNDLDEYQKALGGTVFEAGSEAYLKKG